MLAVNPHPRNRGRGEGGKGRETYKLNMKTALLLIIRQRMQNTQNTGNPGPDSPVGRNCVLECTDRDLDQDRRQDSQQGPLQKPAMDEESETLVIPQL